MDEMKGGAAEVVDIAELKEMDDRYHITFARPYTFEGKEYKELDMSALQDMTAQDIVEVNRYLERTGNIILSPQPEATLELTLAVAARALKLPIEFFYGLPVPEAVKVKNRVAGFFYGAG